MKPDEKPREETMQKELLRGDAGESVAQYISVAIGAGSMYIDSKSVTNNLHGKQNQEQRDACRTAAEKHGLVNLSIPGGSSYQSREVNVLYEGTAEYDRLMGDVDWDVGGGVQGSYQFHDSGKFTKEYARKQVAGRGNLQLTFGISNHNYGDAQSGESGEVALPDVQNEANLHKYFPDRGRGIGEALAKLAAVRDALAKERGDSEYNDAARNQVFSGRTGEMFGLPTVGFENASLSLTGRSRTLDEMKEKLLEKLDPQEQAEARSRWEEGEAIETVDHEDTLNPEDDGDGYSRTVLGKWRIHLARDRDGEVIEVTLIGNHRASVTRYQAKMKGIRGLGGWISKQQEARIAKDEEEEGGHTDYDADGDFLAHGGSALRLGFVPTENQGINKDALATHGAGGFVSYSRPLSSEEGPWKRHRETSLQGAAAAAAGDAAAARGGGRPAGAGGRKRKRATAAEDNGSGSGSGTRRQQRERQALCDRRRTQAAAHAVDAARRTADEAGPLQPLRRREWLRLGRGGVAGQVRAEQEAGGRAGLVLALAHQEPRDFPGEVPGPAARQRTLGDRFRRNSQAGRGGRRR